MQKINFDFPDMPYINDARFFCDTLPKDKPYSALVPRNHESLAFVTNGTLGYTKNGKTMIVSGGLGTHSVNFRLGNCSEVPVVTLRASKEQGTQRE